MTRSGVGCRARTGDATAAVARPPPRPRALLAAEQVGGAQRGLDLTIDYAKTRLQFAWPIGSFQAVKQRLAEMLVQVESARSTVVAAWAAAAADDAELAHIAATAR